MKLNLSLRVIRQHVKTYDDAEVWLRSFLTWALHEGGKIHAPSVVPPGKGLPLPFGCEGGWDPESVRTQWRREKSLPPSGIELRSPRPCIACALPVYGHFNVNFINAVHKKFRVSDVDVLDFGAVYIRRQMPTFRGNILPPSSLASTDEYTRRQNPEVHHHNRPQRREIHVSLSSTVYRH